MSDVSPLSDAFRPCGGPIDCNPLLLLPIGVLLILLLLGLLIAIWRWYGGRSVYVTAQVDMFGPVTLGRGPKVGMAFVRRGPAKRVVGVAPAEGRDAHVRIRYTGGETFEVRSAGSRRKTQFGRVVQVTDPDGRTHELVLRAYDELPRPMPRPDDDDAPPEAGTRRR